MEVKKAESGHTGGLGRCRIAAVSLPDRCRIAAGSLPPRCRLAAGSAAWRSRGNPETSGGKNLSGFFKSLQKNLATKNNQKFAKSPGMKNRHFSKSEDFEIRRIQGRNQNQKNSNQKEPDQKNQSRRSQGRRIRIIQGRKIKIRRIQLFDRIMLLPTSAPGSSRPATVGGWPCSFSAGALSLRPERTNGSRRYADQRLCQQRRRCC